MTQERISDRRSLLKEFDRLRNDLDLSGSMEAMDRMIVLFPNGLSGSLENR